MNIDIALAKRRLAELSADGTPLPVAAVAREFGLSASAFSRAFAARVGIAPKRFALARRLDAFKKGARRDGVVAAQNEAGFGSSSRLYDAARGALGMTPGAWARGGAGETIAYAFASSPAGRLLVARTARGICAAELGGSRSALVARLRRAFPNAELRFAGRASAADLPRAALDLRGTAFQLAVWGVLRAIPSGQTRTYAQVAAAIGRPSATRAVARAIATNPAALAVPCHRVIGSDGSLRGYKWGAARKKRLLAAEARGR